MDESNLKDRFRKLSLAAYHFTRKFPKETVYFLIEKQFLRCSSSASANYHSACRGKSKPDFINKLRIVEEELDETIYWLEYTNGINPHWCPDTKSLLRETNELLAITVASIKTASRNLNLSEKGKNPKSRI
jgi:four helix bundle protein